MNTVYILHHVHEISENTEDIKLIGVYSSKFKAQTAISKLQLLEGFKECPDGFEISEYHIDQDYWSEGYSTIE
ncbi:DUF7336 domain-containing protein [Zooshikella ganghwensis]|uniref:DUF7336 domain-containing protein n=1 Tax=Zooshikella ganghwensis TaxID=202772 RepID=UPI0003FF9171|nr:hypothetical protein [Zooshikella ganghwensis]